jgi:hypothetical protein
MVKGAREFVGDWVRINVRATGSEPVGDTKAAQQYSLDCWKAADKAGIKAADIEKQLGSLIAHMASVIMRVNDAEVARLAVKHD